MPIFEYACQSCGAQSEFITGVTQALDAEQLRCASCGATRLSKMLSPIHIAHASRREVACESGACSNPSMGCGHQGTCACGA